MTSISESWFDVGLEEPLIFNRLIAEFNEARGEKSVFDASALKSEVTGLLVSRHDFTMEEAEETVNEDFEKDASTWNENASADDLANYLASDDNDE